METLLPLLLVGIVIFTIFTVFTNPAFGPAFVVVAVLVVGFAIFLASQSLPELTGSVSQSFNLDRALSEIVR